MKKVYTLKELAKEMGVPWQTVAAWKRKNQIPAKAVNSDGTFDKAIIAPFIEDFKRNPPENKPQSPVSPAHSSEVKAEKTVPASVVSYDDFVRRYWQKGTRAVDVLLLPPEIGPKIVEYVNEALRYGYETFKDR